MIDTIFIVALVTYLGVATVLLYREPTHGWGFPLFVLLYPISIVGFFFASARVVLLVWLGLALANMAIQYIHMNSAGVRKGRAAVLIASLFMWPVQFAAAINSAQIEKEENQRKQVNRQKVGVLPTTIKGTVSHTHHHGTEEGHDSVWLEELDDLALFTDSSTYDRIGIVEGKVVSLAVDERDAPDELAVGKVLWILDGRSDGP